MADATITPSRAYTRWQASAIHLLISAAIAAVSLFLMLRVWYPPPLFTSEGGGEILFILITVDVIIGPLITLIIFKSGKPSLRFDLTMIALVQASALAYGVHVMFVARPVYIALVGDQFQTVRANDLDPADVAQAPAAFRSVPINGPVFVAVQLPKDMKALKALISEAAAGGELVQHRPKYYVKYSDHKAESLSKSHPLDALRNTDKKLADRLDRAIADTGRKVSDLNFLPLETRRGWGAVLVDGRTGDIVKILPPTVLQLSMAGSAAQQVR